MANLNFKNKNCCVIGRHGFIGSALVKKLKDSGAHIQSFPTPYTDYVFDFGSPTHMTFEKSTDYYMREIIDSFLFMLSYCKNNNIYFIWPSSALIYEEDKKINFRHCKMALEEIQQAYDTKSLGLRLFPVYGPGESSKSIEYTTAIYQWCSAMILGEQPIIFGDGTQKRDFIYIDDAIDQILDLVAKNRVGIADVGVGDPISFNNIIRTINKVLKTKYEIDGNAVQIKPIYKPTPDNYSMGIYCKNPGEKKVDIESGIKNIIESL